MFLVVVIAVVHDMHTTIFYNKVRSEVVYAQYGRNNIGPLGSALNLSSKVHPSPFVFINPLASLNNPENKGKEVC